MKTKRVRLLCAAVLAGSAIASFGAASAQAQDFTIDDLIGLEDTPENEIVVAHKLDPEPEQEDVRQQVRSITSTSTGSVYNEPLARFQARMCPGVMGLPLEVAERIVDRLRYNAERLGLTMAEGGSCRPNFILGFVGSGKADIEKMNRQKGSLLSQIKPDERRELLKETGPVRAIAVTMQRTRDGMPILGDQKYGLTPTINTQSANSLFLLPTRVDIEMSVVLIDVLTIDGMTVNQLADYATMRGLAKTRPVSGEAAYGTILNLFDPDASHPLELTNFDLAYLEALYSRPANIAAVSKFGTVQGKMKQMLASADSSEDQAPASDAP
ncbi:hypothetical protein SZ64_16690 [Erythrobacter sp. SG61-1L]|uniref:hypothetical protein n=1 Tax=Erythrobacter sp. SG61-1L TaxID=1603897 RepID=UPI0006C8E7F8|nr:hypothetical protein [Erythrobacter sp. SG61-1L]KPL69583.1 hypothetical protein SZ64_16690 [Erythrobacter sp. SG61-1L]